jgi:hypothetical protein
VDPSRHYKDARYVARNGAPVAGYEDVEEEVSTEES